MKVAFWLPKVKSPLFLISELRDLHAPPRKFPFRGVSRLPARDFPRAGDRAEVISLYV